MYKHLGTFFSLCLVVFSCSSEDSTVLSSPKNYCHGEYIYRMDHEHFFDPSPSTMVKPPSYPWETNRENQLPKITKEFFRCKGSVLNPPQIIEESGSTVHYYDCGGGEKHSLPLRNGAEFVYPILLDLLNYIQDKTRKRIVITSGHRCREHNAYIDPAKGNRSSKHMMGAEVAFYVQGFEENPEKIFDYVQQYYRQSPKYENKKEYEFQRCESSQVRSWCNKEIFFKTYDKQEGRNLDNRHPYPYIALQVRYDFSAGTKVIFNTDDIKCKYR